MKTVLILMLTGALVGVSVASFVVPPMLSWYTSPGGLPQGAQIQAVVQIPEVIRYATSKLLWGQTIGGGMGAVVGLLVSLLLRRKGRGVEPSSWSGPTNVTVVTGCSPGAVLQQAHVGWILYVRSVLMIVSENK